MLSAAKVPIIEKEVKLGRGGEVHTGARSMGDPTVLGLRSRRDLSV
jgi:hypothetical protein